LVDTDLPFRFEDVDFQLDTGGDGEIYRAKDISVTKTKGSEDIDQMGTTRLDTVSTNLKVEWNITIDEVSGNFTTLDLWVNTIGATHDIRISKGSATLTLTNAEAFGWTNNSSSGSTTQLVLNGTANTTTSQA
jgi:hypothetical protein